MQELKSLKKWKYPRDYMGADWTDCYVVYSQHRDSDILTRSNFRSILKSLGGESENVVIARASHWAYGWLETLLVHESDKEHLKLADEIMNALSEYPVADEEDYSELQSEEEMKDWDNWLCHELTNYCPGWLQTLLDEKEWYKGTEGGPEHDKKLNKDALEELLWFAYQQAVETTNSYWDENSSPFARIKDEFVRVLKEKLDVEECSNPECYDGVIEDTYDDICEVCSGTGYLQIDHSGKDQLELDLEEK